MKSLAASFLVLFAATTAHAAESDWFFKPYVGADYQYSDYMNEDFGGGIESDDIIDTGLHGGNVHVGARIHQYWGVEVGYARTQEGSKDDVLGSGLDSDVDVESWTLDVMGYYPVAPQTELIGTVGVSYAKGDFDIPATGFSGDEEEVKGRIGGGAQYWFTDNLNARALVRYQGADFDDSVDGAVLYTAGLNWQF